VCYAEAGRFGAHFSKNLGEERTWSEWAAAGPGCLVESGDVSSTVAVAAGPWVGWRKGTREGWKTLFWLLVQGFMSKGP
jgi:hypothetical protein